jgi:ABC-type multidrug transport system ATPase subunit
MNDKTREDTLKIMTNYRFWAIYQDYMQGVAGYIRANEARVYCEILFPENYPKKNAIFKFPKKTSVKILNRYKELTNKNKNINPIEILDELKIITGTLPPQGVILEEDLENEIKRAEKYYKIQPSKDKYLLKIEFESSHSFYYSVELSLHNYPKSIEITFSNDLTKTIGQSSSLDIIKNWNPKNPLDILEIIDYVNKILKTCRKTLTEDQKISIRNLNVTSNGVIIKDLNFPIPSGELVGIRTENPEIIKPFFNCFIGKQNFSGEIMIFNKFISDKSLKIIYLDFITDDLYDLFHLNSNTKFKKAVNQIKSHEIDSKMVDNVLIITQLDTVKNSKLKNLTETQKRRAILALSLMTQPDLILINKPEFELNDTEQKRIWRIIKELNENYFITTIIYSESIYIKNCNVILIINEMGELLDFGTHEKLISLLPTNDIIILQLNKYENKDINYIQSIPEVQFIVEERKGEKYRIFTKKNISNIVKLLFNELGDKIFNISKQKPDLKDIVPYLRYKKRLTD